MVLTCFAKVELVQVATVARLNLAANLLPLVNVPKRHVSPAGVQFGTIKRHVLAFLQLVKGSDIGPSYIKMRDKHGRQARLKFAARGNALKPAQDLGTEKFGFLFLGLIFGSA